MHGSHSSTFIQYFYSDESSLWLWYVYVGWFGLKVLNYVIALNILCCFSVALAHPFFVCGLDVFSLCLFFFTMIIRCVWVKGDEIPVEQALDGGAPDV